MPPTKDDDVGMNDRVVALGAAALLFLLFALLLQKTGSVGDVRRGLVRAEACAVHAVEGKSAIHLEWACAVPEIILAHLAAGLSVGRELCTLLFRGSDVENGPPKAKKT